MMNCEYQNYYNRRYITVERENVVSSKKTGRLYLIAYQDNIKQAMKDLSASAFKCYIILIMAKDRFIFDYSPQYFSNETDISPDTARKALKELREKNYLIQIDDINFRFYEYPRISYQKEQTAQNEEIREIIDEETGQIFHYSYKKLLSLVGEKKANYYWDKAG